MKTFFGLLLYGVDMEVFPYLQAMTYCPIWIPTTANINFSKCLQKYISTSQLVVFNGYHINCVD